MTKKMVKNRIPLPSLFSPATLIISLLSAVSLTGQDENERTRFKPVPV